MGFYDKNCANKEEDTAKNIATQVMEEKEGEEGGYFTFTIMCEINPNPYEDYYQEDIIQMMFLQKGGLKKVKLNPWQIIWYSGSTVNLFFDSQDYHQHKIVIKVIWVQFNNGKSYINEAITLDGYM